MEGTASYIRKEVSLSCRGRGFSSLAWPGFPELPVVNSSDKAASDSLPHSQLLSVGKQFLHPSISLP